MATVERTLGRAEAPVGGRRRLPGPLLVAAGVALAAAAVVAGRTSGFGDDAAAQTFALVFVSIVVEALPFILAGALVSAAIAVYVPESAFERLGRLPVGVQVPAAALGGFFLPVCECGSVPVARRLILRGVRPAAAVAFMLASPVVNPIVLASTWIAYSGRGSSLEMVLGRAGLGLLLAGAVGLALGRVSAEGFLRHRPDDDGHGHAHTHTHGDHADDHEHDASGACAPARASRLARAGDFVEHLAADFVYMGKFIVLGATAAALLQTAIPQNVVNGIADTPLLAPIALMGLAFMLSLCSEADAFVAVSLTSFSPGSQLAFLVSGPMLDTKLAVLYGGTFKRQFALRLIVVAVPFLAVAGVLFDAVLT